MQAKRISPEDVEAERALRNEMARYAQDPLGFVIFAFPWGTEALRNFDGPDVWSTALLDDIGNKLRSGARDRGDVIREAVAAGNSTGKSACVAWLILWALATYPKSRAVVTANTETQLRTKTWPELAKWFGLFIAKHWFTFTATSIYAKEAEKEWRADAIPWSATNVVAFQGQHNVGRRSLFIIDEACHDDRTEVLTEQGWSLFSELDGTERLLTMNPATGLAEYQLPRAIIRSPYKGKMIEVRRRGASICVTPNHRMWRSGRKFKGRRSDGHTAFSFRDAGKMLDGEHYLQRHIDWQVPDQDVFVLPGFKGGWTWPAKSLSMDDWMSFLGWFCSEGDLIIRRGRAYGVGITQCNAVTLDEIAALVKRLDFNPGRYKNRVAIHNRALGEWLLQYGRNCLVKRAPDCVRMASSRQQRLFLETFTRGDGYRPRPDTNKTRTILYTSSPALANDLQEIALKCGYISVIKSRPLKGLVNVIGDHTATSSVDGLVVSIQIQRRQLKWKLPKEVDYDGMVYCADVPPHHLLFTRRDGYCVWSGNSGVIDDVWDAIQGSLVDVDTDMLFCVFANPTKNSGYFRRCWGDLGHRWKVHRVDSRTCKTTNKAEIARWAEDYGEDSDFFRVRVKGEFPRAADMQFFSSDLVTAARSKRIDVSTLTYVPGVMGLDVAGTGKNRTVLTLRRGPRILWQKREEYTPDQMQLAGRVLDIIRLEQNIRCLCIDATGIGKGVADRLAELHKSGQLQTPVVHVFGSHAAPDAVQYRNMRAQLHGNFRNWLRDGQIPDDPALEQELTTIEYGFTPSMQIMIETKDSMLGRGLASPDLVDSACLTFGESLDASVFGGRPNVRAIIAPTRQKVLM